MNGVRKIGDYLVNAISLTALLWIASAAFAATADLANG
jgi:hypothetical protein